MERLKFSMSTSVFLTSEENTSEPTMGQKGTLVPSSWAMPSASAVLPVPGAPAAPLPELVLLKLQGSWHPWQGMAGVAVGHANKGL